MIVVRKQLKEESFEINDNGMTFLQSYNAQNVVNMADINVINDSNFYLHLKKVLISAQSGGSSIENVKLSIRLENEGRYLNHDSRQQWPIRLVCPFVNSNGKAEYFPGPNMDVFIPAYGNYSVKVEYPGTFDYEICFVFERYTEYYYRKLKVI